MALNMFEAQRPFVEMALGFLRLGNTALDAIFYDVNALSADLHRHGETIVTDDEAPAAATSHAPARPRHNLDLSALANPEGAVLIVDTTQPPYVSKPYLDLAEFVADANTHRPAPRNLSITGVGSSALGSAAFAWNISKALGDKRCILLAHHGQLATGAYVEEATYLAVYLERAARMQVRARVFGPITPVPDDLAAEAHDYLLKQSIVKGTFDYWCRQADRV